MDQIAEEIIQDIRSRKEESKKTREKNNLLALMQAGLGMAASKNIHPLGAIGEGGMQGLGALAQYRKQEGEETKDIGAQQLGLYRFGAAAEQNKIFNEIKNAQNAVKGEQFLTKEQDRQIQLANTFHESAIKNLDAKYNKNPLFIAGDPKLKAQYEQEKAAIDRDPRFVIPMKKVYGDYFMAPAAVQSDGWSIKPKG
jgi:hypothetical protein